MADRKGRSVTFKLPYKMNAGVLKTSIEKDVSSSITVFQDLGNNEYLVELDSKEGADALIDEGFDFEDVLACEASVSVLFRRKGHAKNGASKRGGGEEERKETLADKPRDFENHPHRLSCLSGRSDI